jgi:TatA/E family protein of Tat protein translocase
MLGATEIIIILIVGGIILFGGNKIGSIARAFGKFTTEYKKGKMEAEEELKELKKEIEETTKNENDREEISNNK